MEVEPLKDDAQHVYSTAPAAKEDEIHTGLPHLQPGRDDPNLALPTAPKEEPALPAFNFDVPFKLLKAKKPALRSNKKIAQKIEEGPLKEESETEDEDENSDEEDELSQEAAMKLIRSYLADPFKNEMRASNPFSKGALEYLKMIRLLQTIEEHENKRIANLLGFSIAKILKPKAAKSQATKTINKIKRKETP